MSSLDRDDSQRRGLLNSFISSNNNEGDPDTPQSPADKVRYILFSDGESKDRPPLFCQLDILCHFEDGVTGWKETSRWLKYEERVDDGNRWSKPHVSTTSLHSINEIRSLLADDVAVLQLDVTLEEASISHIADIISNAIGQERGLNEDQISNLRDTLKAPHKHQHRSGKVKGKEKSELGQDLNHAYPVGMRPGSLKKHKPNKKVAKKLVGGTEGTNILVGQVDYLDSPVMCIVRLKEPAVLDDLNEVNIPVRFMCVCLGPSHTNSLVEYEELGRAVGAIFTDKVFSGVAYKAKDREELLHGIDEYIDGLTVLPPSLWDPVTRLEPPTQTMTDDKVKNRLSNDVRYLGAYEKTSAEGHDDPTLKRTGRLFGGVVQDVKRRYPQYLSDLKDGVHLQCLAAVVFLYFACITPIVTFGGLMGTATENYMGTMESILSGAICGLIYHTFSGQPLTIVGATGPLLVFESIMYTLCKDYEWEFLSFRFFTGMWITLILLFIVAFDLSAVVAYITRFTEESFSVLISLIFIAEAFKKVKGIWKTHPVHVGTVREDIGYKCHCVESTFVTGDSTPAITTAAGADAGNFTEQVREMFETFNRTILNAEDCITVDNKLRVTYGCIDEYQCQEHGWSLEGDACFDKKVTHSLGDVFLLSCFLFACTFGIAWTLRIFRNSNFFPTFVRNVVADFGVLIAILISVGIDYGFGLETPKLNVPVEFKTTRSDRGWVVDPSAYTHWWLIPLSLVPAILACILIFLDQQITAVIVNRKDHKLKKGHGYHLDLFVLSFLILICSVLGLPWFVAATVRSITHVKALLRQSEHTAPGEKPVFLGVREQRLTGICIHILIGVSVLLTPILKFVPMPVLYGVFLYMGVGSLGGVQFFDRILILFMPAKYQPDYVYLRHVPITRVHIFTAIQIICMAIMWTLKSIKAVSITFPLMVLALCFVRKGMEKFFSSHELFWLDHLLPEATRRKKEDHVQEELNDNHEKDGKTELSAV